MPVKKSVRFRVFEQAGFTCAYCGRRPPTVTLELDHITPSSQGGIDSETNLLCSCRDCNRGKGAKVLGHSAPDTVVQRAKEAKETIAQLRALRRHERALEDMMREMVDEVDSAWQQYTDGKSCLSQNGRRSAEHFIKLIGRADTLDAMRVAHSRLHKTGTHDEMYRYWCGVCWRWSREGKLDFRQKPNGTEPLPTAEAQAQTPPNVSRNPIPIDDFLGD